MESHQGEYTDQDSEPFNHPDCFADRIAHAKAIGLTIQPTIYKQAWIRQCALCRANQDWASYAEAMNPQVSEQVAGRGFGLGSVGDSEAQKDAQAMEYATTISLYLWKQDDQYIASELLTVLMKQADKFILDVDALAMMEAMEVCLSWESRE